MRPFLPDGLARNHAVQLRLNASELRELEEAARFLGIKLATYVRQAAMEASREIRSGGVRGKTLSVRIDGKMRPLTVGQAQRLAHDLLAAIQRVQ